MSDIVKSTGELVKLIHGGELERIKPFENEIHLFDSQVAGTGHVEGIEKLTANLKKDDKLIFFREADNPYDSKAILINTLQGEKLGYVPRADNLIFSRLMDAGKLIFGRVEDIESYGNWIKIKIGIYLLD